MSVATLPEWFITNEYAAANDLDKDTARRKLTAKHRARQAQKRIVKREVQGRRSSPMMMDVIEWRLKERT